MRIKNVGRSTIIFNGGSLDAGKVAIFQGESEKLGATLLRVYPEKLIDLDNIKQEDIVDVVVEAPKGEAPKKASSKGGKKSKK